MALPSWASSRAVVTTAATIMLAAWGLGLHALWRPGHSALTWDDFRRVELAQQWAAGPFLSTGTMIWLPLQTWVYGIGFAATGDLFADRPLLLAALVNTAAVAAAAALVGRAAWLLFGSAAGALLAFATILFSPWIVLTALSGLAEPLYYGAIALTVWALAAWQRGGGLGTVAAGSLGVAAASALRYEGWFLVPVWLAVFTVARLRPLEAVPVGRPSRAALAIAALPALVPLGWMILHAVRRGSAFSFTKASAEMFARAYGVELFDSLVSRLGYYPLGLLRSAPVLVTLLAGLAVIGALRTPRSRLLIAVVVLHLAAFYIPSVMAQTVGGFTERFMFAFVLALSPLLGTVPGLLGRVRPRSVRVAASVLLLVLLAAEATHGVTHRPEEWTQAPDLLEVTTALGDLARDRPAPLRVLLGAGFRSELGPLRVQNGRRLALERAPDGPVDGVPAGAIRIEKLPARVREATIPPSAVIGRYHLYGPAPARTAADDALGTWRRVDEGGIASEMRPLRVVGLDFTGDDPEPRARARVERTVPRAERPRRGSLAVRWMYGHGFNLGRVTLDVAVDGRVLFATDIGAPSRWQRVEFEIPAGPGDSTVTVAVRAGDVIESGWGWGRAAAVVVKDLNH